MNRLSEPYTAHESLAGVRAGIGRCLEYAADRGRLNVSTPGISAWSVQDHLEHMLFSDRHVLGWVVGALTQPNPEAREHFPRETGVSLLAYGSIPRGRGPAPELTLPAGLDRGPLADGLEGLRDVADGLALRTEEIEACRRTLPHHVLGYFTPAEWLRFLHLHHRHHEAIIRDILAA